MVSIKLTVGYHPYKNLDFSDVSGVEITFGAKEPHLLNSLESEQIIDALREITIYRKLLYQVGVEGTKPEMFIFHYKNGKTEIVAANGKDFMINYVIYRSNYETTEVLNQLWSEFLGRYY